MKQNNASPEESQHNSIQSAVTQEQEISVKTKKSLTKPNVLKKAINKDLIGNVENILL